MNKKGFTLIEILAAVTILGILSAIAIVSVNKVIQQGKEKHYTTAEKNLMLAGQSYAQENRNELPKVVGQKKTIPLRTLQSKNYIKEILDYSDNACDIDKSYVQIYKYSQSDYSYLAYLECPSYKSNTTTNTYKPTITINMSGAEKKDAKASVKVTDDNKLVSYSYTVYKDEKEIKNSGSIILKDFNKEITFTLDLSEYTPSTIKVVVTATNIYGNSASETKTSKYKDTNPPTCIIKTVDQRDKTWIKGSRTITIGCDDGAGTGCTKKEYTKTFNTTTKYGEIVISDEAKNETNCKVSVFVDNTAPSCTSSGGSTVWTNGTRTLIGKCNDGIGSGCRQSIIYQPYNNEIDSSKESPGIVYDNVGNYTKCPNQTVRIDKTAPTCTTSKTAGSTGATVSIACNDKGGSGVLKCPKETSKIKDDKMYTVTDKAGNSNICSVNITVKQRTGKTCTKCLSYSYECPYGTVSGTKCTADHGSSFKVYGTCYCENKAHGGCTTDYQCLGYSGYTRTQTLYGGYTDGGSYCATASTEARFSYNAVGTCTWDGDFDATQGPCINQHSGQSGSICSWNNWTTVTSCTPVSDKTQCNYS